MHTFASRKEINRRLHLKQRTYECRKHQGTNAQRHAGILHHATTEEQAVLCQRHHIATEGCGYDSGGRHIVPPAEPPAKGQDPEVRMAGEHTRTAQKVLFPDYGRRRGSKPIEPELERTDRHCK